MPGLPVVLYPTPVQGEGAAQKIAQAIQLANARKECDVLIVCRGGGSIEDLWAFNEEVVARAIAGSRIPVVSGVGHETDFTIADFVADQRAATPTAAAQAVAPSRQELSQTLQQFEQRMARALMRQMERAMQQLDFLQRRLVHPAQRAQQQMQHLGQLQQRLQSALVHGLQNQQWRWQGLQQRLRAARPDLLQLGKREAELGRRLQDAMWRTLERNDYRLTAAGQHLQHLDPSQVLARGYSMVRNELGSIVTASAALQMDSRLDITFAQGWARVEVKEKGGD